jgi:hypothetical protein
MNVAPVLARSSRAFQVGSLVGHALFYLVVVATLIVILFRRRRRR